MKSGLIRTTINGKTYELEVRPNVTLLDFLRDELGLTGTKRGCEVGECGACTILVDGVSRLSCLMVAAQIEGKEIVTIEGFSSDHLHPIQEAFITKGAIQCGFCTPGMVLATADLLKRNPAPNRNEIRKALSGNICRCTGYQKIVDAVESVKGNQEYDHE